MNCPFCKNPNSRVVDTREIDDGMSIRRRRECTQCKRRFTTLETSAFQVVKRSGDVEAFYREKVIAGVRRACQGRPVSEQDLKFLAQQVEDSLRARGVSTVSSEEVGKTVLSFLSTLDEIGYLRYASVYRSFKTLADFEEAIAHLRDQQEQGGQDVVARKDPVNATPSASQIAVEKEPVTSPDDVHTGDRAKKTPPPAGKGTATKKKRAVKKVLAKRATPVEEPTLLDQ